MSQGRRGGSDKHKLISGGAVGGVVVAAVKTTAPVDLNHGGTAAGVFIFTATAL